MNIVKYIVCGIVVFPITWYFEFSFVGKALSYTAFFMLWELVFPTLEEIDFEAESEAQ